MKKLMLIALLLPLFAGAQNTATDHYNRGNTRFDQKDFTGAIAEYDQAIAINSRDEQAYYNRGLAKYNLKDNNGAISDYTQAIAIKPQYSDAYTNRGLAKEGN